MTLLVRRNQTTMLIMDSCLTHSLMRRGGGVRCSDGNAYGFKLDHHHVYLDQLSQAF